MSVSLLLFCVIIATNGSIGSTKKPVRRWSYRFQFSLMGFPINK